MTKDIYIRKLYLCAARNCEDAFTRKCRAETVLELATADNDIDPDDFDEIVMAYDRVVNILKKDEELLK